MNKEETLKLLKSEIGGYGRSVNITLFFHFRIFLKLKIIIIQEGIVLEFTWSWYPYPSLLSYAGQIHESPGIVREWINILKRRGWGWGAFRRVDFIYFTVLHILGRVARRTRILLFVVTCIDDTVYKIMLSADKHNSHFNIIILHVDIILACKWWKYPMILWYDIYYIYLYL